MICFCVGSREGIWLYVAVFLVCWCVRVAVRVWVSEKGRARENEDDFSQTDLSISYLRAWAGFFWTGEVGRGNRQDKKKKKPERKDKERGGAPPPPPTIVAFRRGAQMLVTRRRKRWLIEIGDDDEGHILCGGQQDCCWQNCFPLSFISSCLHQSPFHRPRPPSSTFFQTATLKGWFINVHLRAC